MCLIVFAYRVHPDYPIILAANRDEFYNRPTLPLDNWQDESGIVAGKDLEGGGTWLGINRRGRLAALTNYREPHTRIDDAPSRGHLVSDFLKGTTSLNDSIREIDRTASRYNGFNILLSEKYHCHYTSNRGATAVILPPGVHGLSNHLLNTPWPKVVRSCRAIEQHLSSPGLPRIGKLMEILADRSVPADSQLPRTGVGMEWERRLGSIFIHSDLYGTRSSTVLLMNRDGMVRIRERSFTPDGFSGEVEACLQIPPMISPDAHQAVTPNHARS